MKESAAYTTTPRSEIDERDFESLSTLERFVRAYEVFGDGLVSLTSGGRTSALMIHHVQQLQEKYGIGLPVVFVQNHEQSIHTLNMVDYFEREMGVDVRRYRAKPDVPEGLSHQQLQWHLKHEPLDRAYKELGVSAALRGVRWYQNQERREYPFVRRNGHIWEVYPTLDWKKDRVRRFLRYNDLPVNEGHRDVAKDEKKECRIGYMYENGID